MRSDPGEEINTSVPARSRTDSSYVTYRGNCLNLGLAWPGRECRPQIMSMHTIYDIEQVCLEYGQGTSGLGFRFHMASGHNS